MRFTKGVTNVASDAIFGQLGMPDPTKYHVFFDDFDHIDYQRWAFLVSQTTDGTEAIQDTDDGRLLLTLPAVEDSYVIMQAGDNTGKEIFTFESGKKLWLKAKFQINDVDQTDFAIGLTQRTTTDSGLLSGGAANGVLFSSDDGDAYLDIYMRSGSVTIASNTVMSSLTDATDAIIGFYFDGINKVQYFNGETNLVGDLESTSFPTTELLPGIAFRNGEASANTLNIDYICVIKERY